MTIEWSTVRRQLLFSVKIKEAIEEPARLALGI